MKRLSIVLLAILCAAVLATAAILFAPQLIERVQATQDGDADPEASAESSTAPNPGKTSTRAQERRSNETADD